MNTASPLPDNSLALRASIETLRGVGPARARAYRDLGIVSLADLLQHLPRRIEPIPELVTLEECSPDLVGAQIRVRARIRVVRVRGRRRIRAIVLELEQGNERLRAVQFGPSGLRHAQAEGDVVTLWGTLESAGDGRELRVVRRLEDTGASACWLEYRLPRGVGANVHRALLAEALARTREDLQSRRSCSPAGAGPTAFEVYSALHQPRAVEQFAQAKRVLALEEAVELQGALVRLRRRRGSRPATYRRLGDVFTEYERALPFALHEGQRRVLEEIRADLEAAHGMARLLSGDVGSGKTVLASAPVLAAARHGHQGVLLAPTEVLARQHLRFLEPICAALRLEAPLLVSGSTARHDRDRARHAGVLVGTHRLLSQPLELPRLAACVIDEQHKFGVRQRVRLWCKGSAPDLLLVSATPIPRTLAHAFLGHLDHSRLSARPDGVRQVTTRLWAGSERSAVADRIGEEVRRGGRVFVVCPAIHDNPTQPRGVLPAAEPVHSWLQERLASSVRTDVLHGKLRAEEKEDRIARLLSGELDVLVSTVVIEVGIDVPDASLVVVLGAERFGLSQLHQIRGRVGRRGQPAECLLVVRDPRSAARGRLEQFCTTEDGFELAELDLAQRGPGEILGLAQHGALRCRFPEILTDPELIEEARQLADRYQSERHKLLPGRRLAHAHVAGA